MHCNNCGWENPDSNTQQEKTIIKKLGLYATTILVLSLTITHAYAADVKWAMYNLSGDYDYGDFHNGVAVIRDKKSGKYGTLTTQGKIQIEPKFDQMENFAFGLSWVKIHNEYGFINKAGMWVLGPSKKLAKRQLKRKQDGHDVEIEGLYEISDSISENNGYWYQNRFILKTAITNKYKFKYPYIIWDTDSAFQKTYNIEDGKIYRCKLERKGICDFIQIVSDDRNTSVMFNTEGEIIPSDSISSSGVRIACKKGMFAGLIDSHGDTILSHSTDKSYWDSTVPVWQNQRFCVFNMMSGNKSFRMYDSSGNIILEQKGDYIINHLSNYGLDITDSSSDDVDNYESRLYSLNGRLLHTGKGFLQHEYKQLYYTYNDKLLINTITGQKYECKYGGEFPECYKEDIFIGRNNSDQYFIIDLRTNKYIKLNGVEYIGKCGDGVIQATKNKKEVLIDYTGKTIMTDCDDYTIMSGSSEGVFYAKNERDWFSYGYIYNPVSKYKTNYSNTGINQLLHNKGYELLQKGKYSAAKECYYEIIMNTPGDINALINYGVCLDRLGFHDDAIDITLLALELEPDNTLAKGNITIYRQNKQAKENSVQYDRTSAILNGISGILNVLGQSFQQYQSFTSSMNDQREERYSSQNNKNTDYTSSNKQNDSLYKNQASKAYSNYESQLIKMNTYYEREYNNTTRLNIQSSMRNIRKTWESKGYTMFHSPWEDWDGRKK